MSKNRENVSIEIARQNTIPITGQWKLKTTRIVLYV